ncbi:ornithine cyclodeaminase [Numidum massiliense]|uniref:ornithine cyclodeaminase n=1 Tax=Numidum massiliense TaxID=1522315 RepID=UPI0006D5B22E|nr:ornithine cyclodeaminase [Numidum massiliense]
MFAHELLYLSQSDVIRCGGMSMRAVMADLAHVLALHAAGDYVLPPKVVLRWGDLDSEGERGRINGMPGYVGGSVNIAGMKWVGSAPHNPAKYGLPRASALIVLNDPETMLPLAVMDGTVISAMRTGGVTGVAARYLARPDATLAGIIGAGTQNRTQLMALKTALPQLATVRVYDLSAERAAAFAEAVSAQLALDVIPVTSGEEAVRGADVVVTATTAKRPVVEAPWFGAGCFYAHVGGFEAEYEVVERADQIVVDHWEGIKHRGAQTLALMYREGRFSDDRIDAELGEIVTGDKCGRTDEDTFIYFNAVGMALDDLVVAKRVYDTAKTRGVGTSVRLWEEPAFV